jgi:Ca2+-binding EF-hand superfamily protein
VISLEEFRIGCEKLNKSLHPDYQLANCERMLEIMDFDGSGTIDINEFLEVCIHS